MDYEIKCPKCQIIRVVSEEDDFTDFLNVPCLQCNQTNTVLIFHNEVHYESEEEKANSLKYWR